MIKLINEMMQSLTVFKVGTWITVIFTILLIILLFMKTSRDERGRAIIGTASIYSTIVFIVLVNILAKISLNIEVNYVCTFRINGAPFPRQRCKRLAPAVRYPFVVTC